MAKTKIAKKETKKTGGAGLKPSMPRGNPKINKFLFGHTEITKTDILEVVAVILIASFLAFVYLKVHEIL